jgi:hypothetical protein
MALLVSALTVALASANTSLLKFLRGSLQYVDRIAAGFVVLSGLYLLWYFYWVDIQEEGDPVTDWALARQAQVSTFLNDHWQVVGVIMAVVVGGAAAYVMTRPGPPPESIADPAADSARIDAPTAEPVDVTDSATGVQS